mmetsp:Transcript_85675/g.135287  ORF Transcript_85675/g.135287 Transcript_85675/m.135287 type:complete len:293 (+) Transcript_85675:86-964(+)
MGNEQSSSIDSSTMATPLSQAVKGGTNAALDRIGGALWGLFIADAMAMPTHWYYGGAPQIRRDYGGFIQGYTTPKMELQGSIMNKSSTGGGGRGSDQGEIIGTVINHGKKQYWTARGSYHYHCTLAKGENTLEAQLTRLVCKSIVENAGSFVPDDLRQRYIKFMTTVGSHNDCYASTCHRMFFANLTRGVAPERCPDNDNHNVDTIDGLIMAVPVALAGCRRSLSEAQQETASCTKVTRNSTELPRYAENLAAMLRDLVAGAPINDVLSSKAGRGMDRVVQSAAGREDPVVA